MTGAWDCRIMSIKGMLVQNLDLGECSGLICISKSACTVHTLYQKSQAPHTKGIIFQKWKCTPQM